MNPITLAMIVRDEAEKLARCLRSVQGCVNEIVIVDTGSGEATVQVAESFNARVKHFRWPEAFDMARNSSLEMVATEWVLWLDADEWLVEGSAEAIRQAVRGETASGFFLLRRDLLNDKSYSEQLLLRLWRHDPKLVFHGAIHEHLDLEQLQGLYPGKTLKSTNIAIWHDGYSPALSREKALRNLPLLRKETAKEQKSLYYEIELAQTLKALGDSEWRSVADSLAAKIESMRDQDEPPDNTVALFLMRFFADQDDKEVRSPRTDLLLRIARGWFPDHPGLRFICAQTEIKRGDLRAALNDLLDVEHMAETGDYDRFTSTNPIALGEGLSTNLALVAHQLGRKELSRKHYLRLLELSPNNPVALENLKRL